MTNLGIYSTGTAITEYKWKQCWTLSYFYQMKATILAMLLLSVEFFFSILIAFTAGEIATYSIILL